MYNPGRSNQPHNVPQQKKPQLSRFPGLLCSYSNHRNLRRRRERAAPSIQAEKKKISSFPYPSFYNSLGVNTAIKLLFLQYYFIPCFCIWRKIYSSRKKVIPDPYLRQRKRRPVDNQKLKANPPSRKSRGRISMCTQSCQRRVTTAAD